MRKVSWFEVDQIQKIRGILLSEASPFVDQTDDQLFFTDFFQKKNSLSDLIEHLNKHWESGRQVKEKHH